MPCFHLPVLLHTVRLLLLLQPLLLLLTTAATTAGARLNRCPPRQGEASSGVLQPHTYLHTYIHAYITKFMHTLSQVSTHTQALPRGTPDNRHQTHPTHKNTAKN